MGSKELTYWMAFQEIEGPIGQTRDDILAAMIAERITTMQGGKKAKKVKITDFIMKWGGGKKKTEQQTPEQQKSILKALTSRFKGSFTTQQ